MKLTGIVITCNYPDDICEAAVPSEMTVEQLCEMLRRLFAEKDAKDMTSIEIVAAIGK